SDGLFQGHDLRRGQPHSLVLGGRADVGQLLALQRVDVEVVAAAVRADDHPLIDLRPGVDEYRPALLEVPQRVSDCRAVRVRYQDAVATAFDRPLEGRVAVKEAAHHAGAAGIGEKLSLIADQAPRRAKKSEAKLAAAGRPHL